MINECPSVINVVACITSNDMATIGLIFALTCGGHIVIQDHAIAQLEQSPHLTDPTANHGEPVVVNRQLVLAVNMALGDQLRLSLDSNDSSYFISHKWRDTGPFK